MNYEMSRVYRAVIDDVIKSLEEESLYTNIELSLLDDLKEDWLTKISEYTDRGKISELRESTSVSVDENGYVERDCETQSQDSGIGSCESTDSNEYCENYLMCLYIKVTKCRNKWKCSFKDGFINIGPLDFAFSTAQGDLYWC